MEFTKEVIEARKAALVEAVENALGSVGREGFLLALTDVTSSMGSLTAAMVNYGSDKVEARWETERVASAATARWALREAKRQLSELEADEESKAFDRSEWENRKVDLQGIVEYWQEELALELTELGISKDEAEAQAEAC